MPEGSWRDALARQLGVSPDDDFGLLSAIGAECAGAVALRNQPDWVPEQARYSKPAKLELAKWMKNPAARPQLKATPGLRLSLAGAQDKLLIHIDQGRAFLCEGGAPSTVILKPDILDPFNQIELSALNELLAMRLAAKTLRSVPRALGLRRDSRSSASTANARTEVAGVACTKRISRRCSVCHREPSIP